MIAAGEAAGQVETLSRMVVDEAQAWQEYAAAAHTDASDERRRVLYAAARRRMDARLEFERSLAGGRV